MADNDTLTLEEREAERVPTEAVAAGVEEEDGLALDDTLTLEEREADRVPIEGEAREVALLDTQAVEEREAERVRPTVALLDTLAVEEREAERVPAAEGETQGVALVNKLAVKRVYALVRAVVLSEGSEEKDAPELRERVGEAESL